MGPAEAEFWRSTERYHDLAREYERHVERVHPPFVTSNRLSPWSHGTFWTATSVIYYEYRGPRKS